MELNKEHSMSSNKQRLGEILGGQMKKTANAAVPIGVELGNIGNGLSLTTDSMKRPIPKGAYMVDLMLVSKTYRTSSETVQGVAHTHRLPDDFRTLKAGDRVLVAWCGNEPVVIAIVVSS